MAANPEPDASAIVDAVRSADDEVTSRMKRLADDYAARAARLTKVQERLQNAPHPPAGRLQELAESIAESSFLGRSLASIAERLASRPKFNPADIAIFGQVVDSSGAGLPLVWVRVTDQDGGVKVGDRAQTSQAGDFSLVFKECEIPAPQPALLVAVEDGGGKRLGASDVVALKAGTPAYVQITLAPPKAAAKPSASKPPPTKRTKTK